MIDDAFHLTPLDVRRMDFGKKALGGYDPHKVDEFRSLVADELFVFRPAAQLACLVVAVVAAIVLSARRHAFDVVLPA